MKPAETAPSSRRELRAQTGPTVLADPAPVLDPAPPTAPTSPQARLPKGKQKPLPRVAFGWVDEGTLTLTPTAAPDLATAASPFVPVEPDLLARAPRRSPFRAGILVPIAIFGMLIGTYSATTILWPLNAVEPTIQSIQVDPIPAPAAAPVWPAQGSGSVSVAGIDGVLSSTADADSIASITKVVTALLVLDQLPLSVGEQGPEYHFTSRDQTRYWGYRWRGESALEVPVGGTLTEYQLLEGMLIGSANNYADRLAQDLWPTDAVFASAAAKWLTAHGVPGIAIVEPTGFDSRNTASAAALIPLAQKALANPVIAQIVAKTWTELPGAGHVENTNGLLYDPGVIGVKTGSLDRFNLLAAKNVTIGETAVRLYAAVLGQADDAARIEATRALFAQLEADLQTEPSVTRGTTVGMVDTVWGEHVAIVTDADAAVVLWNGGAGTVTTAFDLGDSRDKRDVVGSLAVRGPLDSSTVDVELAADIEPPTMWWRLTHPLELFGLDG